MSAIVDVSSACTNAGPALYAAGVRTVIRYYSRDTTLPSKRLTRDESLALASAGLRLCAVYEGRFGDRIDNFDRNAGVADALYAREYAATEIRQPAGSTVYFAVDFDASANAIRQRIVPYFQGIADILAGGAVQPTYVVGAYGSGAVCAALLDRGLAQRAWLAQSTGWAGYKAFLDSRRWTLRQRATTMIAGIECDPDESADGHDVGDFAVRPVQPSAPSGAEAVAPLLRVSARSGLHLRSGPGTGFGIARTLPFGTLVRPLKHVGAWTMVDLEGDGAADGFVCGAFLVDPALGAGPPAAPRTSGEAMPATRDAAHVPELVRNGSSSEGLRRARLAAADALEGYPANGCAAHLSALLRQSGIDVAMTLGAGRLVHVLRERGWTQIRRGEQIAGDVGVCYDLDPSPPGADHVYLVVGADGPDEMNVADNQRTTDAPHVRYASGRGGKTPTEYFLRAVRQSA